MKQSNYVHQSKLRRTLLHAINAYKKKHPECSLVTEHKSYIQLLRECFIIPISSGWDNDTLLQHLTYPEGALPDYLLRENTLESYLPLHVAYALLLPDDKIPFDIFPTEEHELIRQVTINYAQRIRSNNRSSSLFTLFPWFKNNEFAFSAKLAKRLGVRRLVNQSMYCSKDLLSIGQTIYLSWYPLFKTSRFRSPYKEWLDNKLVCYNTQTNRLMRHLEALADSDEKKEGKTPTWLANRRKVLAVIYEYILLLDKKDFQKQKDSSIDTMEERKKIHEILVFLKGETEAYSQESMQPLLKLSTELDQRFEASYSYSSQRRKIFEGITVLTGGLPTPLILLALGIVGMGIGVFLGCSTGTTFLLFLPAFIAIFDALIYTTVAPDVLLDTIAPSLTAELVELLQVDNEITSDPAINQVAKEDSLLKTNIANNDNSFFANYRSWSANEKKLHEIVTSKWYQWSA